ncbi:MAG: PepSY-associated TM helix domain-containing protein [Gammaproteobacteria bacterium]
MLKLPQRDTKTLLAIHGWSGILLGLLLYTVICTGVAAVFAEEINDWASPLSHADSSVAFTPGIDTAVRRHAAEVDPQFLEEIAIFPSAGGRVNMRYHRDEVDPDGKPSARGVEVEMDPATWQPLARRAGWEDEIEAKTRASGIADWLINLHVRLHIPEPYGLFVTGVLGLAMMIAAITGLVVHRHLLTDLFTLRLGRDALLRRRDLHVVAGSWNLPFANILAFTGSFFSFASSIGLPAIAMVQFGGNQEALADTLYGTAQPENRAPGTLANLEAMLADARARNHAEPDYVSIEHYGRADATVTVSTALPANTLVYSSFIYEGITGAFIREKPPIGKIPSFGGSLLGLMYPLHFGNFAGVASKAVWVGLGGAAAYVSLTGMLLWTRRREEQPAWRRMARAVHYVGYGLPLGLVCAPYAFFLLKDSTVSAITLQDIAFLVVAALAAAPTLLIGDLDRLRRALLAITGIALIGLPPIRWMTGGPGWGAAWNAGIGAVPVIDAALVVFGALCLSAARSRLLGRAADDAVRAAESSRPASSEATSA